MSKVVNDKVCIRLSAGLLHSRSASVDANVFVMKWREFLPPLEKKLASGHPFI